MSRVTCFGGERAAEGAVWAGPGVAIESRRRGGVFPFGGVKEGRLVGARARARVRL